MHQCLSAYDEAPSCGHVEVAVPFYLKVHFVINNLSQIFLKNVVPEEFLY